VKKEKSMQVCTLHCL